MYYFKSGQPINPVCGPFPLAIYILFMRASILKLNNNSFIEGLVYPAVVFCVTAAMAFLISAVFQNIPESPGVRLFYNLISVFPYFIFIVGIVLGWRFRNTGVLLSAFSLSVVYLAFNTFGPPVYSMSAYVSGISKATIFLFPLNIILVSLLTKRQIFIKTGSLYLFLFSLQVFAAAVFFNPKGAIFKSFHSIVRSYSYAASKKVYLFAKSITVFINDVSFLTCVIIALWSLNFLLVRYYYKRDKAIAGFTGIFATAMTGMLLGTNEFVLMIYFAASGIILVLSVVEASFSLNTIDAQTGLPSRRAIKDEIDQLKDTYVIAMVDIDNFSSFNDRFGPDIGDAVIGIVAEKLADSVKGIKTFRYGGEEFVVLLPGFDAEDAMLCLETYRRKIESFPILVKNKKQYKNQSDNAAIQTQVTVSIGAAASNVRLRKPGDVLEAADKALELAKGKGKNRIVLHGAAADKSV